MISDVSFYSICSINAARAQSRPVHLAVVDVLLEPTINTTAI